MLKSMTGYGWSEKQVDDFSCKSEIRSVNNRYIDVNVRLPRYLSSLELPVKKIVKANCSRGSFDLTITIQNENGAAGQQVLKPNLELASQYMDAFRQIQNQLGLKGDIDISAILSLRDIIKSEQPEFDSGKEDIILESVQEALTRLIQMREEEGKNLEADISNRLGQIEKHLGEIKTRQPQLAQEYKQKLQEKIKALTDGIEIDEARLAQETAIMADRSDISEEIIRLESHLQQYRTLLNAAEPIGRKLEFITQEINRETNTIGSKSTDHQISQTVIEIKSLLEKIREQLQNVE